MIFVYLNYSGSSVHSDVNANSQNQAVKLRKNSRNCHLSDCRWISEDAVLQNNGANLATSCCQNQQSEFFLCACTTSLCSTGWVVEDWFRKPKCQKNNHSLEGLIGWTEQLWGERGKRKGNNRGKWAAFVDPDCSYTDLVYCKTVPQGKAYEWKVKYALSSDKQGFYP